MWAYVFIFLLFALSGSLVTMQQSMQSDAGHHRAQAVAYNMMAYNNAVIDYAKANPAFVGTVNDAALVLPNWYVNSGWTNDISAARQVTVYSNNVAAMGVNSLASYIAEATDGSHTAGVNSAGMFYSSVHGNNPSITIPGAVNDGSPLMVTILN